MARRDPPLIALIDVSAQMGGVEFSTLYLAQHIDLDRFRRLVICPQEGDLPNRCRVNDIPVEVVPQPSLLPSSIRVGRGVVPNLLSWIINPILFVLIAIRLTRTLRAYDVDLVCTKGLLAHFYGGIAARFARIPCVWHVQDFISERLGKLYPWVFGMVGRILARHVIADGTPILGQLSPYIPRMRMSLIYNGLDTDAFSPQIDGSAVRAEWQASRSTILIGNVARLTPWKGQDYLLHAFARIAGSFPEAKLVLIGTPLFDSHVFEQELRQLAVTYGLQERVIFAGFRWDLPQALAALDIYVHPSVEKDTSPLAVISAIASGKPIIVTSVPGVAELFENGVDGMLVPPKDVSTLADSLRALLNDDRKRRSLAQAARSKAVRALSIQAFARECERVFEAAMNVC